MYAHQLFIVIVGSNLFSLISARISTETVKQDSADLSELSRQIKELSPAIARQFLEASCQVAAQCCPQSTSSVTILFNMTALINQCFGEIHSPQFEEKLLACAPLTNLTALAKDPELKKLMSIIALKTSQEKDELQLIVDACSEKEIYAVVCDWNAFEEHQICRRKLLTRLAEQYEEEDYHNHVEQRRRAYNDIVVELKTQFHS